MNDIESRAMVSRAPLDEMVFVVIMFNHVTGGYARPILSLNTASLGSNPDFYGSLALLVISSSDC